MVICSPTHFGPRTHINIERRGGDGGRKQMVSTNAGFPVPIRSGFLPGCHLQALLVMVQDPPHLLMAEQVLQGKLSCTVKSRMWGCLSAVYRP